MNQDVLSSTSASTSSRIMSAVNDIGLDNVGEDFSFLPELKPSQTVARGEHCTERSSSASLAAVLQEVDLHSIPCMFQTFVPERGGRWCTDRHSLNDQPQEDLTVRRFDPVEAIERLWRDPSFANHLVYEPTEIFRGAEGERMYSEMYMGEFWNSVQSVIPEGGTVATVIIASDNTYYTQSSENQMVYPRYLTIGNIPWSPAKPERVRAFVPIPYLSTDRDKDLLRTALKYEMFRRSIVAILGALTTAGNPEGGGLKIVGRNDAVRTVYPILAAYLVDCPEQRLLTCERDQRTYETTYKLLGVASALLSSLKDIQNSLSMCLQQHKLLSNRTDVTDILDNLRCLHEFILRTRLGAESTLFHRLDAYSKKTTESLHSLMELSPKVKLLHISSRNFRTIGVGRWLDDEIINYFVKKWCSNSPTTLGLSTFFACKFLFEGSSCICARSIEHLTLEDENMARKWCLAAEKAQGYSKWECVFIPINEDNAHWYSACINFRLKRVDIYDSLREVCLKNREKPVQSRKNTNTMLVLMWFTELLGRMRGEEVLLKNNPSTTWCFDPHAKVPFQPNSFDCGVHTLWHLQHVIEFGFVREDCELPRLKFSDDMTGKRLRLAQEVLDDCNL